MTKQTLVNFLDRTAKDYDLSFHKVEEIWQAADGDYTNFYALLEDAVSDSTPKLRYFVEKQQAGAIQPPKIYVSNVVHTATGDVLVVSGEMPSLDRFVEITEAMFMVIQAQIKSYEEILTRSAELASWEDTIYYFLYGTLKGIAEDQQTPTILKTTLHKAKNNPFRIVR